MVKVRYDKGLTSHIGPESCVAVCEDGGEALTGVRAGQAIERRNIVLWVADAVRVVRRQKARVRIGEDLADPRRQRPWHVRKSSAREPGDLMTDHRPQGRLVRDGKAQAEAVDERS
jgi:hypothetical protein